MVNIKKFVLGMCATNCYIVSKPDSKECIIIDPGDSPDRITDYVMGNALTPVAILLTHGHFDHAAAADTVARRFSQCKIYAAKEEITTLADENYNLSRPFTGVGELYGAEVYLSDGEQIKLAGMDITMILTPGHTVGSCCFYLPYEELCFTGDTLFENSVGRTDFPGGSMATLMDSIMGKLMTLPGNTRCLPGHNDETTIEEERVNNPFLMGGFF